MLAGLMDNLKAAAMDGLSWWGSELSSMLPAFMRPRAPKVHATLFLNQNGELEVLRATKGRLRAASDDVPSVFLAKLARRRPGAHVRLKVPASLCLERRIEVPKAARRKAEAILDLDLERATPFRAADVFSAHMLEPSQRPGWLTAVQLIAKRKSVEPAIRDIEAFGLKVASLDCGHTSGKTAIAVDLMASDRAAQKKPAGGFAAMSLLAVALTMSLVYVELNRRESAVAALDAELATVHQRVSEAQASSAATAETLKRAQAVTAFADGRKPAVEILDELTRLLPDDTWLEAFKLDGGAIEITGFAKSASAIVPVLDRSSAFKDVEPMAPITFDGVTAKEHFSYRIKLRDQLTASAASVSTKQVETPEEVALP